MQGNYSVRIEGYAQTHFIKSFARKYKGRWDQTLNNVIIFSLERIDTLLQYKKAEIISDIDGIAIIKTKFAVIGSGESANSSGNRCIVSLDKERRVVSVLLVYSKNDLSGHNETEEWKEMVKVNYPEHKARCK